MIRCQGRSIGGRGLQASSQGSQAVAVDPKLWRPAKA